VKICSLYGAGFFYMPGTDTCLKVGGFVRAEVDVNAGGSFSVNQSGRLPSSATANEEFWRTRAGVTFDARTQTAYGTLRSYFIMATTEDNGQTGIVGSATAPGTNGGTGVGNNPGGSGRAPYTRLWSNAAFIQLAGFTVGKTASFFDFDTQPYSNQTNFWSSNYGGSGIDVFAYTAQFGNGWSASISVEEPAARRMSITNNSYVFTTTGGVVTAIAAPSVTTGWQYGNQQVPDIVGNLRVDQAWGSAQVMAAYHQVRGINTVTPGFNFIPTESSKSAFAVGGGLKLNTPYFGAKDYVLAQANYSEGVLSYVGQGINGGFALTNENGTLASIGPGFDAVVTNANGDMSLTKAWSFTGGFEHFWSPEWKTSLYGSYGALKYDDAASAVLRGTATGPSADWNYSQIGSRTVWTPVANLDLSVEVMYNNLNTAFATGGIEDRNWWSGIFRVQRNFYP